MVEYHDDCGSLDTNICFFCLEHMYAIQFTQSVSIVQYDMVLLMMEAWILTIL